MTTPTPRKSLGQHWLQDETILWQIIDAAAIKPDDTVLEIGPGPGSLTKLLVHEAKQVVAVELDVTLATQLPQAVPTDNLQVVMEDILQFDLNTLPAGYKVVANIPYYLTSNLIRVLSECGNPPTTAVMLIQKEVAERATARPGDMSVLSVTAQYYWQTSLGIVVPASAFTPPPKVDSQVLILQARTEPLFHDVDTKQFIRLVKAGFSQRRKTLQNSLSGGLQITRDQTLAVLQAAGIAANTRAQALDLDQWHDLYLAWLRSGV
jgi:16S rRNA (adenine1518-N6/adenine1519-N6)-dimethyltransferase